MSKQKGPKVEEFESVDNMMDEDIGEGDDGVSKCTLAADSGKKRSWTADEDAYLMKLVQKYGAQKWTSIAEHLPGMSLIT